MKYFSPSTCGFYDDKIHITETQDEEGNVIVVNNMPDDAESITDAAYNLLFAGQAAGKIIVVDENNLPALADVPPPSNDQLAKQARLKRSSLLAQSDWTQLSDVKADPAWQVYRQALRDVTKQEGFPNSIVWPEEPIK